MPRRRAWWAHQYGGFTRLGQADGVRALPLFFSSFLLGVLGAQTMEGKVLEAMEILRATRASAASAVSAAQHRAE